ncbi:MAG: helix-turn-helix transcriptional regulator [Myxococcota bacterium]|jgi:transcriptional regulator with XRE-family HTH domain|nr:helix-turn-helix transcriptional regulator [Myxococcota bacterium]
MIYDDDQPIHPDGLAVRRRRHEHGWSSRDLVEAIASACERATGNRKTITPNLLKAIEEQGESIPYGTLCLIADGLGCDPVDILPVSPPTEGGELIN